MRHASQVHQDTQNILDNKYSNLTQQITQDIEKACADGKFESITCLSNVIDNDTSKFLKGKLQENGYSVQFTQSQRDGCTVKVSWKSQDPW